MKMFDRDVLFTFIKNAKKLAIVAIGNELSGDDAIGVIIGEELLRDSGLMADIFIAYQSPEAYLMKLIEGKYTHVLFIDGIEADASPGEIFFVEPKEIISEQLSTHRFPLKLLLEILLKEGLRVLFIGIQVKKRGVGVDITDEVKSAGEYLIRELRNMLKK